MNLTGAQLQGCARSDLVVWFARGKEWKIDGTFDVQFLLHSVLNFRVQILKVLLNKTKIESVSSAAISHKGTPIWTVRICQTFVRNSNYAYLTMGVHNYTFIAAIDRSEMHYQTGAIEALWLLTVELRYNLLSGHTAPHIAEHLKCRVNRLIINGLNYINSQNN